MTYKYILLAVGFRRFLPCLLLPDRISDQLSDLPGLSLHLRQSVSCLPVADGLSLALSGLSACSPVSEID